jgi:sulfatase maturation enzyme AslB (radical SAM superfamily)
MPIYKNPEKIVKKALSRCYVTSKAGGLIPPPVIDVHPISGRCNLNCSWCVGKKDRETIEPLPSIFKREEVLISTLNKILSPYCKHLWTSRFHICGSDSEPLLAGKNLIPAIRFLLQRHRIVKLITNGLLLDDDELVKMISKISELSISLDVTNDRDYEIYKGYSGGYTTIIENIKKINKYRKEYKSQLHILVTFVATPKTYDQKNWKACFEELKHIGVNQIKTRNDLNETYGLVEHLKADIEQIDKEIKGISIEYNAPDKPYKNYNFKYCMATRIWPTLGADGCLYPCAHTANSKYEPFADLTSSNSIMEAYTECFSHPTNSFSTISDIGCERQCPPTIGSFNYPEDAKRNLCTDYFYPEV